MYLFLVKCFVINGVAFVIPPLAMCSTTNYKRCEVKITHYSITQICITSQKPINFTPFSVLHESLIALFIFH